MDTRPPATPDRTSDPHDIPTELATNPTNARARPGVLSQAYLVCRLEDRVDVVHLTEESQVVVGRVPDAGIRVDSPRVSRAHARIQLTGGAVVVTDLGSRNGTRVNDEVLRGESRVLPMGGAVEVGPMEIFVARATRILDYDAAIREEAEGDETRHVPEGVVVADAAMRRVFEVLGRLAAANTTVLIVGETGVGKEIVAEQLHLQSARGDKPFVRLNCASVPETLLESELFGHERGAFSGADRRRAGYFEAANGGSLLLDEIGEMPVGVQTKLLRVLERRAIIRVGATSEVPVDVRILAATHRDLAGDVAAGRFRRDLYYRISTFTVEVPPLRERRAEVLLLADLFARRFAHEMALGAPVLERSAVAALLRHDWPGNVRELRNAMEHAIVLANGAPVQAEHLPRAISSDTGVEAPHGPPVRARLDEIEREAIVQAIAAEAGNHTHAARRLGMSRRALLYKLAKYKLRG